MKRPLSALLRCLAVGLPALANAEGLLVQVPAALSQAAPITAKVREECAVPELVGNNVLEAVGQGRANVRAVAAPTDSPDPMLQLTLLSVQGVGGGGWSGRKSVSLRAELVQNGQPVAVTVLNRSSSGGMLGGVTGTCPIFERIAQALGRDVAAWLPSALASRDTARPPVPAAPPETTPAQ